jgi:two-component sensor histidine kinase
VLLSIEQAMPCALIVNELMMSRIKGGGRKNNNELTFSISTSHDDEVTISVSDRCTIPGDSDVSTELTNLSLTIVTVLVEQLGGRLNVTRHPHMLYQVRFSRDTGDKHGNAR